MKKRFSEEQIIGLLREAEAGLPVAELCRRHGFSDASFYLWRSKFGGMNVSDAKKLKELEVENARGIQLFLIKPGKPNQNAYIESFNGRFRNECLNEHWFTSLQQARMIMETWRRKYNEERPKKSLGGLTPYAYSQTLIQKSVKLTSDSKAWCY